MAIPTPLANPCPKGPVVVSTPGVSPCSGWPGVRLAHWRKRFFEKTEAVRALGYPDAFIRMWEYYLCYCEGGFTERDIGTVQMVMTKPGCRRDPVVL